MSVIIIPFLLYLISHCFSLNVKSHVFMLESILVNSAVLQLVKPSVSG